MPNFFILSIVYGRNKIKRQNYNVGYNHHCTLDKWELRIYAAQSMDKSGLIVEFL